VANPLVGPEAQEPGLGNPRHAKNAFAIGRRRDVVEDAVPAGLKERIVRQREGRAFEPVWFRIVAHQVPVIVRGPHAMLAVEEQGLGVDQPMRPTSRRVRFRVS